MVKGFASVIFKYLLLKGCTYAVNMNAFIHTYTVYYCIVLYWLLGKQHPEQKKKHLYIFPCYGHVLPSIWLENSKTDWMISLHSILFGYYYTSFIKALSLTLFWALISNSIRVEWSMTEYLKFWGGGSQTFLAASNFLPVCYVCNMREIPYQIHLAFL